jgi:hypothetical protein
MKVLKPGDKDRVHGLARLTGTFIRQTLALFGLEHERARGLIAEVDACVRVNAGGLSCSAWRG